MGSCGLEIHYDPAIASATSVTLGPGVTGGINANFTTPGVIIIGWYTYPALTLPGNPLIFTVYFARVISGTTLLTWYDNGMSCYWKDGNYQTLNDIPTSTFYIDGSLTFTSSVAADFSADNLAPPNNTTVTFTDLSTGSPTNWAWSFNRPSAQMPNSGTS